MEGKCRKKLKAKKNTYKIAEGLLLRTTRDPGDFPQRLTIEQLSKLVGQRFLLGKR